MDRKKGSAKIFGYKLSKSDAKIVYFLGLLLFVSTLIVLAWILYWVTVSAPIWKANAEQDVATLGMWLWMTYLIVDISFMFLACYMMRCSKIRVDVN